MSASPYKQLELEFKRLHAFRGALSLLRWDAAVMMPRGSADLRGEQRAALETEYHAFLTAPRITRLLDRAQANAQGLADWIPRATQIFSDHYFHITLEVVKPRAPYRPGEEPVWNEHRGPSCRGLPSPPYSQANPAPGWNLADGANGSGNQSPSDFPGAASGLPSYFAAPSAYNIPSADSGLAGTAGEQQVIAQLLSQDASGAHPSAITTLLAGPILRGTTVNQT